MLRSVLVLAVAGLIFMVSETAQAASIAPLTAANAFDMGQMQYVSWRRALETSIAVAAGATPRAVCIALDFAA